MLDLLARFLIGGAVVSLFAIVGDVLKPKSLGGLFCAAPTIALATICLTARTQGPAFVSLEARSMVGGALAFFVYACVVSWVLMRYRPSSLMTASGLLLVWAASSAAFWAVWLRR